MRWMAAISLAAMIGSHFADSGAAMADCPKPTDLHDGWTVAAPEQEALDPALICGIGPRLEALEEAKAHGVVIARHGRLVYEHYFTGDDQRQSMSLGTVSFDAETKHDMRSVSKSVTSLLVGIAFDRGLLTDLDASAFSFFPEYEALRTPEKDRVTLRHLLTMSSGLAWDELPYTDPSSSSRQMEVALRADHYVLAQPLAAQPGEVFNYNTGTVNLLGLILQKVSGKRLDDFAKETLFDPLGIEDWDWDYDAGFNPAAGSGLRLRPRDLAKIGQLVLERGKWQGRQIVSSSWIEESTIPRLSGDDPVMMLMRPEGITSYGYLWWLGRSPPEHPERDMIAGTGNGGQRVFILPSLGAVVVTTAGRYGEKGTGLTAWTTLNEFVFPSAVKR